MTKMTGGQAAAQSLKRQGLEVIFGLPGVQLDWLFDGLYDVQDTIKIYHTRNEQATSYMADGYARSTGKVGACLVVPGPGLLNAAAGLSTAYATNSPVLCIAGQIVSHDIEKGKGLLHEIPNQLEMVRSVTKWAGRAKTPEEIPGLIAEAFRQLRSGRQRPVEIEIPPDVLQAEADIELLDGPTPGGDAPSGDPDKLEAAAKALGEAKKPIIFVGGGIISANASDALLELATVLQAPVVMSGDGRGAVSDRHYLGQNMIAGQELFDDSDVILIAGTRFLRPTEWGISPEQTVIQLDIDPTEIGRNRAPDIGIVADAKKGLTELVNRVGKYNHSRESREEELNAAKEAAADLLFEVQPQASYAMAIRQNLPDDGILISGMTQVGYWNSNGFPVYQPRTFLSSGYQGTLGFEFTTALGAQVGNPDKKVVMTSGDGGFMYTAGELATMAQHHINAVAVVFNDGAYGNVYRIQKQSFNGRTIASQLQNPDYVKLAEAFGVDGRRAKSPDELSTQLGEALAAGRPCLIECPVGEMPGTWGLRRRR